VATGSVPVPPICELLVRLGRVSREESYRVFNMGFGFVLVVGPEQEQAVVEHLEARGEEVHPCGEIVAGERGVELRS
jgi:phosphoribosylformylglycinamidine cyclo-ligase